MYVLGTAGHVDHGKSTLLAALTGMQPDRLPEEKKRGMTIDLNFVWISRKNGEKVGIVDVPGHHRFVKNMISGVMNVDGFILIVAADDGWMPQTEEHVQVLKSLGVNRGFSIVTKTDLASSERVAEVKQDVSQRLEMAFGQKSSVLDFAAPKAESTLPAIREAIENLLESLSVSNEAGAARLWVDRVFTPKGKGVVVTGTLREGPLGEEDVIVLSPSQKKATVKSLQTYQQTQPKVEPVTRVAVQLSKISAEEIERGELIQQQRQAPLTRTCDVKVRFFEKVETKNVRLGFHIGTARQKALVIPFTEQANEEFFARIKFGSKMALRTGDRFLLRASGEEKTLAGGVVVDPRPRHRSHKLALKALEVWQDSVEGSVGFYEHKDGFVDRQQLWSETAYSKAALVRAIESRKLQPLSAEMFVDGKKWENWQSLLLKTVQAFHDGGKEFIADEQLIEAFGRALTLWTECTRRLLGHAVEKGKLVKQGTRYQLKGFTKALSPQEEKCLKAIEQSFVRNNFKPLSLKEFGSDLKLIRSVTQGQVKSGRLVNLGEEHFILSNTYQELVGRVSDFIRQNEKATTSELRTLTGLSRKLAVFVLERMDRDRVTYLKDGVRRLLR